MAIVVRKAERRDMPALGRLGAMLVREHYAFDRKRFLAPPRDLESGYASFLGRAMESPDSCVFVAEENGDVVGYAFAALEPMSWIELRGAGGIIHDIAVAESARRKGVGSELMKATINWLREKGAPQVILLTATPNHGAHELFKRIGFRDTMTEMTLDL